MSATLRLRGKPVPEIDFSAIIHLINEHEITYGLLEPEIHDLLKAYHDSRDPVDLSVVIVKGKPVIQGENGRIEILVENTPVVTFDEDGRADYRNIEKYRTVEKGQLLAKIYPPVEGTPGINIFGEEVSPRPVYPVEVRPGPNVVQTSGTVECYARIHGIFIYNAKLLDVSAVLEIPGNVGLESGNVHYDGSVNIQGSIERGSKVIVDGDVTVGSAVESGSVHTGGSLTVRKGINTRQEDTVLVGGNLKATYVDNSILTVDGIVTVEKSIVASRIYCHSELVMTSRGSAITGGEIVCYGDITVDSIGNRTETPTKITVGEHYRNIQLLDQYLKELEGLLKQYEKVADEIVKIKILVQRRWGNIPVDKKAEFRMVFQQYREMQEKIQKTKERVEYYKRNRFKPDEVKIIVRDTIYPGVEIHYRTYVDKLKAPLSRCILKFKQGMEKPEMEGYRG